VTELPGPLPLRMVAQAVAEELDLEPVDPAQVVSGNPATGYRDFGSWQGLDVGVWEMTPGSMRDVEVEEVFVVIAGDATLTRIKGGAVETVELSPGVVCHLEAGEDNLWEVRVALRKIYFAPRSSR